MAVDRPLPPVLRRYWRITILLFGCACVVVLFHRFLNDGYPLNTLLFDPHARFSDFTVFQARIDQFHTPAFYANTGFKNAEVPFNYPPLMVLLLLGWFRLSHGMTIYLLVLGLTALAFALVLARALIDKGISRRTAYLFVATSIVTSFPLMFAIDRLNFEGMVWIATGIGLIAFARRYLWLAATCVGLAAAMKLAPVILFALFMSRKTWRQLCYSLLLAILCTVVSLKIIGPTVSIAAQGALREFHLFATVFVPSDAALELGFQHSLFSLLKQVMVVCGWGAPQKLLHLYQVYSWATAAGSLLLYFTKIRKLPWLNQMIALQTCAVVLPWWSGDYTLLHLYVPWGLLLLWIVEKSLNGHEGYSQREMLWFLIPFAILFTPQSYMVNYFTIWWSWGGSVKAIALLILLMSAIRFPLQEESSKNTAALPSLNFA